MEYVNLGDSGLKVSRVALGSWLTFGSAVDASTTRACVQAALEGGVIFFDTADVYARGAAEELLGEALSDVKRTDIVLATKAFWPMSDNPNDRGLSRKHLVESVHASLGRLRTDYLDLFQCHRYDEDTPLHETVATMGMLIDQGKVLYWGVSCWTAAQILDACHEIVEEHVVGLNVHVAQPLDEKLHDTAVIVHPSLQDSLIPDGDASLMQKIHRVE